MNRHFLIKAEPGKGGMVAATFQRAGGGEVRIETADLAAAIRHFSSTNPGELVDLTGQLSQAAPQQFASVDLLNFKRVVPEWVYMSGEPIRPWNPEEAYRQ